MNVSIGLQLYSVRDELAKNAVETLERIASIGYKNLELAVTNTGQELTVGGMQSSEFIKTLDRLGMKAVSTHVYPMNNENWENIISFNKDVGSSAVVYPIHFFSNRQEALDLSLKMNQYGETCKKHGIDFYFHNHFHEFQKVGKTTIMDTILENTDPDLVKIEVDTYWVLRGGVDPIDFLRKLGGRCDMIHQKDLPAAASPVNWFDLLKHDEVITEERFSTVENAKEFAEVGEGVMDIPGILNEIRKLGFAKYIFIEQDLTSLNQLESVELSFNNMSKLWNS